MCQNNKYNYLLSYSLNDTDRLLESVYDITESFSQKLVTDSEKTLFFSVMKKIIERGDFNSYSCINLLRDIMTDDLYNFMLNELKKFIFNNEPLAIEIMKIITCNNFPEYYNFLDSVKNDTAISLNFRKFINIVLKFEKGEINHFTFPLLNRKDSNSHKIEIDWCC